MLSFTDTRYRATDPESSRLAAKTAAGGKAAELRRAIQQALRERGPMTAKQIAVHLDECFYAVSRRCSETAHIRKTGEMVDGGMVLEWAPGA